MVWKRRSDQCFQRWLRRSFCGQLFQCPAWPSPSHLPWLWLSLPICKGTGTFAEHFGLLLILHRACEMWWTLRCYKSTKYYCYYWTQEVEVAGAQGASSISPSAFLTQHRIVILLLQRVDGCVLNKPKSWKSLMKRNEADDILNFSDFSQCKAGFLRTAVPRQLCQSHLQLALSSYPPINRRHRATIMAWQYLHTLGFCCSHEGKKKRMSWTNECWQWPYQTIQGKIAVLSVLLLPLSIL